MVVKHMQGFEALPWPMAESIVHKTIADLPEAKYSELFFTAAVEEFYEPRSLGVWYYRIHQQIPEDLKHPIAIMVDQLTMLIFGENLYDDQPERAIRFSIEYRPHGDSGGSTSVMFEAELDENLEILKITRATGLEVEGEISGRTLELSYPIPLDVIRSVIVNETLKRLRTSQEVSPLFKNKFTPCAGFFTPIQCTSEFVVEIDDDDNDEVKRPHCPRCERSRENIQRYRDLREEGHNSYSAGLMSGLTDPGE